MGVRTNSFFSKISILFSFLLFISVNIVGQEMIIETAGGHDITRCSSDELMEELFKDPVFVESFKKRKEAIMKKVNSGQKVACGSPIVIPVAVHFAGGVTTANTQCLIDKCNEQILVLNQDFGGYNLDIMNYCPISDACPSDYPPDAVTQGSCMQFCLASSGHPACEPPGNLVGGLAITVGVYSGDVAPCWAGYCNLFVRNLGGGLLGYAPLFGGANPNGNGGVITTSAFGGAGGPCTSGVTLDNSGSYNLGRTATHELGHYFGLNHVFNGCGSGDGIADTPSQSSSNFGCPTTNTTTCTSTAGDTCGENDFWFNFMDYVNDACMWMFTEDQSQLMYNTVGNFVSGKCSSTANYAPIYPTGCGAAPLMASVLSKVDVLCNGDMTGFLFLDAEGGTPPYSVTLNGIPYGPVLTIPNLAADTYTIVVTDALGEFVTLMETINEPDPIVINETSNIPPLCFNGDDGSFQVEATGGTPVFTYVIPGSPSNTTGLFQNLTAGNYLVTVTDGNGCIETYNVALSQPIEVTYDNVSTTVLSCFGDSTGVITVEAIGGTPDYMYEIAGVETNDDGVFEMLWAGTFTVEVSDMNGCMYSEEIEITGQPELFLEATEVLPVSCGGNTDGQVTLAASGGSNPYEYSIDGITYQASEIFPNLGSGLTTFYVIDDNGCIEMVEVDVIEDSSLELTLDSQVDVDCFGDFSGSAEVSVTGSVGTVTYTLGMDSNTTGIFTGLTSGMYTISAVDDTNCPTQVALEILQTGDLAITVQMTTDIHCNGDNNGILEVFGSGGDANYMYSIDGISFGPSNIFDNLPPGMGQVFVEDGLGCQSFVSYMVVEPDPLEEEQLAFGDASCFGGDDGTATIEYSGGTGTITYTLGGQENTTGIFTGLGDGPVTITFTDENGCNGTASGNIGAPDEITSTVSNEIDSNCDNDPIGGFTITGMGGAGGFTYELGGVQNTTGVFNNLISGNQEVLITDQNNCTTTANVNVSSGSSINAAIDNNVTIDPSCMMMSDGIILVDATGGTGTLTYTLGGVSNTTGMFTGLPAGMYVISILDEADCLVTVDYELTDPAPVLGTLMQATDVLCFGSNTGTATINGSGGTGTLNYQIVGGASNSTGLFTDLLPDSYTVIVTDANNCEATVNFSIDSPAQLVPATTAVNDASCFGGNDGTITMSGSGGIAPYTYFVNGVEYSNGIIPDQSNGNVTVTIEDDNGCTESLEVAVGQAPQIQVNLISQEDAPCLGIAEGAIEVNADGGNGGFTYILDGVNNGSGIFNGLDAGSYTMDIEDQLGCPTSYDFNIAPGGSITATGESTEDTGEGTGTIEITADGGTLPYSYSLNGGAVQTSSTFNGLTAGTYQVQIVDDKGCITAIMVEVEERLFLDDLNIFEFVMGPNPTNDIFNLEYSSNGDQHVDFYIYDVAGKYCGYRQQEALKGRNEITFDFGNGTDFDHYFTQGVYIIFLSGERVRKAFKVVKM